MRSTISVLIVDEKTEARKRLHCALQRASFQTQQVELADHAKRIIVADTPDLVLLGWTLPDCPGMALTQHIRQSSNTQTLPIIMMTPQVDEAERVHAFDVGGVDDLLTKPVSPREVVSRVNAILRRRLSDRLNGEIEASGLKVDLHSYRVTANNRRVELALVEFQLLHFFMTHPEQICSRSQLLGQVWNAEKGMGERRVDVSVRRLRQALQPTDHHRFLQTIRGAGYRFSTKYV